MALDSLFADFMTNDTNRAFTRIHMGKELVLEYPLALENVRLMDRVLQSLENGPSWSIEGKIIRTVTYIQLTSKQTSSRTQRTRKS